MNNSLLRNAVLSTATLMAVSLGATPGAHLVPAGGHFPNETQRHATAQTQDVIVSSGNVRLGRTAPATQTANPAPTVKKTPLKEAEANSEVLIDEDFSLWTAGTRENPIYLGDLEGYYVEGGAFNIMPDKMSNGKEWAGMGVCSADEACGLCYPGYGGMIQTSMGDFSGELHITAKFKMLDGQSDPYGMVTVAVCKAPWINPQPVRDYDYYTRLSVPNDGEWHEVEWVYNNTYGGDDCFVQFNTYNKVLLDDLKITSIFTSLPQPAPLPATNFTYDGFTAHWESVSRATDYLFTCWRDVPTSDQPGVMSCSFEEINHTNGVIDIENPNFPEGWEFDFQDGVPTLFTPADGLDSNALCLNTNVQSITSPSTGSMITNASLKLRFMGQPEEYIDPNTGEVLFRDYPGCVLFYAFDGHKWVWLGSVYFDDEFYGQFYDLDITDLIRGQYYRLQFGVQYLTDDAAIAFDDIVITTLPPTERDYALQNLPVDTNSYVVTDLDPAADYYYEVIARNTELDINSGEPTQSTFAFGIAPIVTKPATDILSDGTYTANWEASPKAQEYLVSNYKVFTAPTDIDDYTVLEDSFDKVTVGTVENPYQLFNMEFMSLDEYCDNPGWVGYLVGLADGAIGGVGYPQYGMGGEIQTPWLTLTADDGKFTVLVSAYGEEGDMLCVVNSNGKGFYLPLAPEYQDYLLEFEGGSDYDCLAFYTLYKSTFFIDYIDIAQNLKTGDRILSQDGDVYTTETSYTFSNLEAPAENYSYGYTVNGIHSALGNVAISERSEMTYVDFKTAVKVVNAEANIRVGAIKGAIKVEAPANATTNIYTTDGILVDSFNGANTTKVAAGLYIVRVNDRTYKLMVK